jgi:ABC-type antimicrobial peptide transport system permease subunit
VIFDFDVSPRVLLEACAFAVAIGAIGAIAPAWHARRLPLARILAERR